MAWAQLRIVILAISLTLLATFSGPDPAVGSDFQVNSYTTNTQLKPAVAASADGAFVVSWTSSGSDGTDPGLSIQARRFAADGTPLGADFQVNSYTSDDQWSSSVAVGSTGDFVVVWQSNGSDGGDTSGYSIQARRFASNGTPLDAQFQVNSYTSGNQGNVFSYRIAPSVAMDSSNNFVIV